MTLALVLVTCTMTMAQAQGRLKGKITDETGEGVPFANVIVEKGGTQVGGASTDFDGNYDINPIPPGTYTLKASCVGYNAFVMAGVVIPANKITFQNIKMESGSIQLEDAVVIDYAIPLISADNTTSGASITAEEISKLPNRSAEGVASSVGGVFSSDGEVGSIRGSREGAVYYIDGVKVIGSASVPQSAIDQVDVILGGTPAMYGDAMGGIINMTTKGPSREWGGGLELEQSVDGYGHSRVGASLQGPLIMVEKEDGQKDALLGFFLAADFTHNLHNSKSAVGFYHATDEWQNEIETNPLRLSGLGSGSYQTAAYTRSEDLVYSRFLNNNRTYSLNVTGNFNIKTGQNTNLTIGGSLYQGTGSYANGRSQYYFNTDKNYISKSGTYRGYIRFTQRFPSDPESTSAISNFYYSIQADYTHVQAEQGDPDLWDNVFAYGNLGKFTTRKTPTFDYSAATIDSVLVDGDHYQSFNDVYVLNTWDYDTLVEFQRQQGDFNPLLSNYVENYYKLYEPYGAYGYFNNMSNIQLNSGLINGVAPNYVYSNFAVPGTIQSGYSKSVNDQFSLNVNGSMTIGKGDNSHEVKLGMQVEVQNYAYRSYSTNYWTLMRDVTNFHIKELDMDNPYATSYDGFVDTVMYRRKYDGPSQYYFDANLRKAMGLQVDGLDYILIDTYDFNDNTIKYYDKDGKMQTAVVDGGLDLSMFASDDLHRNGKIYLGYCGYTYDGDRKYGLFERPSMEDFFKEVDENNIFTRPIAAQQPIYMAGYIQDKFAFKDLIFNIGVRVDRFDANQSVLKDPYILYDYFNAGQLMNSNRQIDLNADYRQEHVDHSNPNWVTVPDNIGDDFAVYVNNIAEKTEIVGYRSGNTWFNADGAEISDITPLDKGTGISPWIKEPGQQRVDEASFTDYNPAWTVMPRISFSFPISDEALFFAHYDVLTQRPSSNDYVSPLEYYYFNENGDDLGNPNLKPMQTIDYELGFTQKVTNTSSLTLTAFYREFRNQIQMFRFNGAFPKAYNSYSNLDFGTAKGLTAEYDLRRTKNARIRASYTLQFANNTGSSTSTAAALIAAGVPNLRSTFPTNADRRHSFNLVLDYRFSNGKKYDGPVINREGKDPIQVLANTGFSLTIGGGSGTPYTASRTVKSPIAGGNNLLQGTYNGSRIPAAFKFDLRVDKDINFTLGKKEGSAGHECFVNVYLQVLNLLNSKNIVGVYAATGNANDDGYLTAPEWQREIYSQIDPQAWIEMYRIYVNNGGYYSGPRQIRLGLSFNF